MRIYKLSNILAIPFALAVAYLLSFLLVDKSSMVAMWAVVPLIIVVLIYLFQPQIDYWWLSRRPIPLDENIQKLLIKTNAFYANLESDQRLEFDKRLSLYVNGRSFLAKGTEKDNELPFDMKHMIAQVPVTLSFYKTDTLLKHYERIVVYKHAFPTPQKQYLHTTEVHHEDGVLIFSMEHAEVAMLDPQHYYDNMWHSFAEAFSNVHDIDLSNMVDANVWESIEKVLGFSKSQIEKTLGYTIDNPTHVLITCFYKRKHALQKQLPGIYSRLTSLLT